MKNPETTITVDRFLSHMVTGNDVEIWYEYMGEQVHDRLSVQRAAHDYAGNVIRFTAWTPRGIVIGIE